MREPGTPVKSGVTSLTQNDERKSLEDTRWDILLKYARLCQPLFICVCACMSPFFVELAPSLIKQNSAAATLLSSKPTLTLNTT